MLLMYAYHLSNSPEIIETIISDVISALKKCKHFFVQQTVYIKVENALYWIIFLYRKHIAILITLNQNCEVYFWLPAMH